MDDRIASRSQSLWSANRSTFEDRITVYLLSIGLGPRKFKTRAVETGDRSVWTDTPADRLRRAQVYHKHTQSSLYNGFLVCVIAGTS